MRDRQIHLGHALKETHEENGYHSLHPVAEVARCLVAGIESNPKGKIDPITLLSLEADLRKVRGTLDERK